MKKKKHSSAMRPEEIVRQLELARDHLRKALFEDFDLEKFTLTLEDGHKLTLEELHHWIIEADKFYREQGPRAAALKVIEDGLRVSPKILHAN